MTSVLVPDVINERKVLVPSLVGYGTDGLVYVGEDALNNQEIIPPQNMISSVKRLVGKTYV